MLYSNYTIFLILFLTYIIFLLNSTQSVSIFLKKRLLPPWLIYTWGNICRESTRPSMEKGKTSFLKPMMEVLNEQYLEFKVEAFIIGQALNVERFILDHHHHHHLHLARWWLWGHALNWVRFEWTISWVQSLSLHNWAGLECRKIHLRLPPPPPPSSMVAVGACALNWVRFDQDVDNNEAIKNQMLGLEKPLNFESHKSWQCISQSTKNLSHPISQLSIKHS